MTDAEINREEFLLERAGMLMSDGMDQDGADAEAAQMWLAWRDSWVMWRAEVEA